MKTTFTWSGSEEEQNMFQSALLVVFLSVRPFVCIFFFCYKSWRWRLRILRLVNDFSNATDLFELPTELAARLKPKMMLRCRRYAIIATATRDYYFFFNYLTICLRLCMMERPFSERDYNNWFGFSSVLNIHVWDTNFEILNFN